MRIVLWLTITVFVSSLLWPQLLNDKGTVYCLVIFAVLLTLPSLRILAVIPLAAIYFTFYANLTLTGKVSIPLLNIALPFSNAHSLQAASDGQDHSIIVQITSLISVKNRGYFTAKLIELDGNQLNYSPKLEMRWYKPTFNVQAGELHAFNVRFKPVYGRANPDAFDRQKWRFSDHVAYQVTIKTHLSQLSDKRSFRARFYQKVTRLSAPLNNQGIILALSFADKTLINIDKKEQIKNLAIAHLFAISGLHIGLLFSFIYLLLHLLVSHFFTQRYLGWGAWRFVNFSALAGALFYAYLAGFSLPTQRAFLMLLLAVVVLSMKRKCALLDLLSLALVVILLWDPLAVLSLSLWLSFSAVSIILIILWRFPRLTRAQNHKGTKRFAPFKRYLQFLFFIQLSLTLLMLPVQLLSFSGFSGLSPFINFIAVPLFSLLIIPLILLGCLFTLFAEPLALMLLFSADYLITLFFTLVDGAQAAYQIYSAEQSGLIILLITLAIVLFIIHSQVISNRKISTVFSAVLLSVIALSLWVSADHDEERWFVEVLDVGQGLAVLVRSQGQTLLYDTGPSYPSGFSTAASDIVPYLNSLAIKRLDYLVVSHSDSDHAGGVALITKEFSPKQIIVGEPINSLTTLLCRAGDRWILGQLSVTVLSPFSLTKNNNNNSCVIHISDGAHSLLLTGDIDKKQESLLLEKSSLLLQSDLLLAPHHGSKHSSSDAFINAVSPQWVIFTAGFMNHWGFPAPEVQSRYTMRGVKMVNSGLQGFTRFDINKEQIKMQTYREDLASYWYHHSFLP